MHESAPLITTLALGLGFGLIFGLIAERLRLPALVGYLLAGVFIGPFTPGFLADVDIAKQLTEIDVMLLNTVLYTCNRLSERSFRPPYLHDKTNNFKYDQ